LNLPFDLSVNTVNSQITQINPCRNTNYSPFKGIFVPTETPSSPMEGHIGFSIVTVITSPVFSSFALKEGSCPLMVGGMYGTLSAFP
jgi:hypothetical protein